MTGLWESADFLFSFYWYQTGGLERLSFHCWVRIEIQVSSIICVRLFSYGISKNFSFYNLVEIIALHVSSFYIGLFKLMYYCSCYFQYSHFADHENKTQKIVVLRIEKVWDKDIVYQVRPLPCFQQN